LTAEKRPDNRRSETAAAFAAAHITVSMTARRDFPRVGIERRLHGPEIIPNLAPNPQEKPMIPDHAALDATLAQTAKIPTRGKSRRANQEPEAVCPVLGRQHHPA
jgi:hypothetical protein